MSTTTKEGVIRSIRGLVVRVEFDEGSPELNEVIIVNNEKKTQLLVSSLETGNLAVCLNLHADMSIQKGMKARRTESGIMIPVGEELIGRVIDATARPIDGLPPVDDPENPKLQWRNIFVPPPRNNNFTGSKPEILE